MTKWWRSVQFYPTICVCQLTQYSSTITTYTHNTRAHHSLNTQHSHTHSTHTKHSHIPHSHTQIKHSRSHARSHRTHSQHLHTALAHAQRSHTSLRLTQRTQNALVVELSFIISSKICTFRWARTTQKKHCLKINFKTTTIFCIAFGMDCCMYLTSIARHSYSLTTVIKDFTNDKSTNDNMGKFWIDILTFWRRTCFYTLVRSHVRTFCKDAQGTTLSGSPTDSVRRAVSDYWDRWTRQVWTSACDTWFPPWIQQQWRPRPVPNNPGWAVNEVPKLFVCVFASCFKHLRAVMHAMMNTKNTVSHTHQCTSFTHAKYPRSITRTHTQRSHNHITHTHHTHTQHSHTHPLTHTHTHHVHTAPTQHAHITRAHTVLKHNTHTCTPLAHNPHISLACTTHNTMLISLFITKIDGFAWGKVVIINK